MTKFVCSLRIGKKNSTISGTEVLFLDLHLHLKNSSISPHSIEMSFLKAYLHTYKARGRIECLFSSWNRSGVSNLSSKLLLNGGGHEAVSSVRSFVHSSVRAAPGHRSQAPCTRPSSRRQRRVKIWFLFCSSKFPPALIITYHAARSRSLMSLSS